jgi:hypothetical protein
MGTVGVVEPMQVAALLWVISDQPTNELPALATDALVRGLDAPALRELAGLPPGDYWDIKDRFERSIEELGLELPDEQTALWRLAQHKAAEIVAGSVAPSTGARWIWQHVSLRIDREGDLRVFIGLASEWDDHPRFRPEIEDQILTAARDLLDQERPRMWLRVQARRDESPLIESGTAREVQPADLPITEALAGSVGEWARRYDAVMEQGRFNGEREAKSFVASGQALVERLQRELGSTWHVEYYPEPTRLPGLRLRAR